MIDEYYHDDYLTISSNGITMVKKEDSYFISASEFLKQRQLYLQIKEINFFKI